MPPTLLRCSRPMPRRSAATPLLTQATSVIPPVTLLTSPTRKPSKPPPRQTTLATSRDMRRTRQSPDWRSQRARKPWPRLGLPMLSTPATWQPLPATAHMSLETKPRKRTRLQCGGRKRQTASSTTFYRIPRGCTYQRPVCQLEWAITTLTSWAISSRSLVPIPSFRTFTLWT